VIEQAMLAELLAMIRGQEHDCVIEEMATIQLLDEFTDLVVEVGEGAIVLVHLPVDHRLGKRTEGPAQKSMERAAVVRTRSTITTVPRRRREIGAVGVIVIQEGEEGAVAVLVYPAQEASVDRRRVDPDQMLVSA
jgi:hypothetical protein